MNQANRSSQTALLNARIALKKGDKHSARHWAEAALAANPQQEEGWLLLAALASPRASIEYLKRALEINPNSQRARKGMHWAIQRYRQTPKPPLPSRQVISNQISASELAVSRPAMIPWLVAIFVVLVTAITWFSTPAISTALAHKNSVAYVQSIIGKSTLTPTPTQTLTSTPTPTNTPLPTESPTHTPDPTKTPKPKVEEDTRSKISLPSGVNPGEKWIDVDLTNQRVYTYKGKNLINAFIASTGTWQHPTVTGQYKIYVMYRYADMAGPGYYLPNVPYVMYFYKGYGIHGTYWHNNFGTPMSHGCVNLRTEDAGWVYNWASIGTVVNIHY
jgi:lipoprotein-anchoring transpeptidase ErfK/SrfK